MSTDLTPYITREFDMVLFIQRLLSSVVFMSIFILYIHILKENIDNKIEEVRTELIRFSVEVWQDDIKDLQKTVKELVYKLAIQTENTAALCSQMNAQSQEMATLKKIVMEEIAMLKQKKNKKRDKQEDIII